MKQMRILRKRNIQTTCRKDRVAIVLLASCIVLANVVASWAQSSRFRIGVLTPGGRPNAIVLGVRDTLERLGYKEQVNVSYVVEDTEGGVSGLPHRTKYLLESKPNVLVAVTTSHAVALKEATNSVPIVFAWVGDPIGSGLAASYKSSKNNLTGVSSYAGPISGKRLEVLKEIAPRVARVLVFVDPNDAGSRIAVKYLEEAAAKLRVNLVRREATNRQEVEKVMAAVGKDSVDAIYFIPSIVIGAQFDLFLKRSREDKLPLVAAEATWVEKGALFSYGADFRLVGTQAGRLVAKILDGGKPSDIPIETPEKYFLAVNVTTAKTIGLKLPRNVLERADRVVE
ncbi:MAG: ABC transporter substrate-binding protein [Deltaproteobacteria bacterium]|nr:ABC transporter substrate-binding protein [Deltaproteobacteria bacterium]